MYLGARENSQKLYCCTQAAIIYHKHFFYKKNTYILLHLSQQLKYISKYRARKVICTMRKA